MRIKTLAIAFVGFVAFATVATSAKSNAGAVKQRLAEISDMPLIPAANLQTVLNAVPTPTLLAQTESETGCPTCGCAPCCPEEIEVCCHEPTVCDPEAECCPEQHVNLGCEILGDPTPVTSLHDDFKVCKSTSIQTVPVVREVHREETACCSNEESTHDVLEKGCKYRHFCIKGDICVKESVTFIENGITTDMSDGNASKTTVSIDHTETGLEGPDTCYVLKAHSPLDIESGICCEIDSDCPSCFHCDTDKGICVPN